MLLYILKRNIFKKITPNTLFNLRSATGFKLNIQEKLCVETMLDFASRWMGHTPLLQGHVETESPA